MALYDEDIKKLIQKLPKAPGIYQYIDKDGVIIYVGKAKNLKNRVYSYLSKSQSKKTMFLVDRIMDIRYVVVENEDEALLLENNLIKQYKPKYNILLKDDKTYPWICISKERYPRVFITRNIDRKNDEYFGPYTSVKFANTLLNLIKSIYKLRTCNLNFTPQRIRENKYKVCLEYHINNCDAPCIGLISEDEYDIRIEQIRNILKGNISSVISYMKDKMLYYSDKLEFENAEFMKKSIDAVKKHQTKSTIVSQSLHNIDVFSYEEDDKYAYVNYIKIVYGAVNMVHSIELEKKTEEDKESLLSFAIYEIRKLVNSNSNEIVVPFLPDMKLSRIDYKIPKKGEKKQLLELSFRNLNFFKMDRNRHRNEKNKDTRVKEELEIIRNDLKLSSLPHRIECFDNSNTQGTNPVAACVVFIDAKPAKREYRKFHVKTVVGPNDYASMEEIIYRRYKRVLEENGQLPNLIVIDGGKGQLSSALNSLNKLNLSSKIDIVGLAKRMEEIYYPKDKYPYILAKNSLALKTLMHIRDEAHRFGITFHRKLRDENFSSSLLNIKGIGKETESKLLSKFGSIEGIKQADEENIVKLIGKSKAYLIISELKKIKISDVSI